MGAAWSSPVVTRRTRTRPDSPGTIYMVLVCKEHDPDDGDARSLDENVHWDASRTTMSRPWIMLTCV